MESGLRLFAGARLAGPVEHADRPARRQTSASSACRNPETYLRLRAHRTGSEDALEPFCLSRNHECKA